MNLDNILQMICWFCK